MGAGPKAGSWTITPEQGKDRGEEGRTANPSWPLWLMLGQVMTDFLPTEPSGMLGTQW